MVFSFLWGGENGVHSDRESINSFSTPPHRQPMLVGASGDTLFLTVSPGLPQCQAQKSSAIICWGGELTPLSPFTVQGSRCSVTSQTGLTFCTALFIFRGCPACPDPPLICSWTVQRHLAGLWLLISLPVKSLQHNAFPKDRLLLNSLLKHFCGSPKPKEKKISIPLATGHLNFCLGLYLSFFAYSLHYHHCFLLKNKYSSRLSFL